MHLLIGKRGKFISMSIFANFSPNTNIQNHNYFFNMTVSKLTVYSRDSRRNQKSDDITVSQTHIKDCVHSRTSGTSPSPLHNV